MCTQCEDSVNTVCTQFALCTQCEDSVHTVFTQCAVCTQCEDSVHTGDRKCGDLARKHHLGRMWGGGVGQGFVGDYIIFCKMNTASLLALFSLIPSIQNGEALGLIPKCRDTAGLPELLLW